MRKSSYEISPSVKQLPANQPGNHCAALPGKPGNHCEALPGNQKQSQIEEDKRQIKTLPKHHHALAGDEQHISLPNQQQQQTKLTGGGETQAASCKVREEHIPVMANKESGRVGGQAMVSIVWLQGSLLLANLVLLFTSLVTLLAWHQLRQQHLVALVEKIENQGVLVMAMEDGWRLEVGLLVTGLGLLLHWLVCGVLMPFRIGHCKGFALLAYLLFNVAAMLWQVCAALAIIHILPPFPSFSHRTPTTERFLAKWGAWLAASYVSCLPVQLISSALHLSFEQHQELDEESVQLRMHMDREGKSHAMAKPEAVVGLGGASQDLSFYVTEMPAEHLKRKSQEPLSPFSRIRSESNNSTLPPSFRSVCFDSNKRFDDYSFNYDEYLDMEEYWEESNQEEGESIFCSGTTPPPPYSSLAIDV